MNLQEAITEVRSSGVQNTRITPIAGTKKSKIEVNKNGQWTEVLQIDSILAEDVIKQATNRVICG